MITELISSPSYIRERLAYFQMHDFADLIESTTQDRPLATRLQDLDADLGVLISVCLDTLCVSQTAAVVDKWEQWCELFEELESPDFEDEILQTYIALPQ
jgi:hypothetical protein